MLSFDTHPQLTATPRLGDLHLPHIAPTGPSALRTRMVGFRGSVGAQHATPSRPAGEATEEGGSHFLYTSAPR